MKALLFVIAQLPDDINDVQNLEDRTTPQDIAQMLQTIIKNYADIVEAFSGNLPITNLPPIWKLIDFTVTGSKWEGDCSSPCTTKSCGLT